MKIDMHVHTKEGSVCGQSKTEAQVAKAVAMGLDAIVITDHNRLVSKATLDTLNKGYPDIMVFGGVELRCQYDDVDEEIIVIGVQDPELLKHVNDYGALHAFVREKGGYMILAHPYRFSSEMNLDLSKYPVDAIELYSNNLGRDRAHLRYQLAMEYGIDLVVNSDSHHEETLGRYYTILDGQADHDQALVALLKKGNFILSHKYDGVE